jgi:GcrA cell cycle regulator
LVNGRYWSDDEDEALRLYWADGLSSSQIAYRMQRTRNAVIGRAHRLDLPGRATAVCVTNKRKRIPRSKPDRSKTMAGMLPTRPSARTALAPAPLPPPNVADVATVSLMDLERHHCRWVCRDDGHPLYDKRYCGDVAMPGQVYCIHHTRRATYPVGPSYLPHPGYTKSAIDTRVVDELQSA